MTVQPDTLPIEIESEPVIPTHAIGEAAVMAAWFDLELHTDKPNDPKEISEFFENLNAEQKEIILDILDTMDEMAYNTRTRKKSRRKPTAFVLATKNITLAKKIDDTIMDITGTERDSKKNLPKKVPLIRTYLRQNSGWIRSIFDLEQTRDEEVDPRGDSERVLDARTRQLPPSDR